MTRIEHKPPGRFAAVSSALCRVFSVFGRSRRPKKSPRRLGDGGSATRDLELEIARLERELDQIYSRVVSEAGHASADWLDSDAEDLSSAIAHARSLKAALRDRRAELTRRHRESARQSRLLKSVGIQVSPLSGSSGAQRRDASRSPGRQADEPSPRMTKAVAKLARQIVFEDSAEQTTFDATSDDLLDLDPEIRRAAVARMAEINVPGTTAVLEAALEDTDDRVRVTALNSVALIGDPSSTGLLRDYARNSSHYMRLAALRGLANIGDERDDPILFAGLDDNNSAVRRAAATYLGWRGVQAATKPLIRALHDDEADVRAAAVAALGNIDDDRAVLSLIRALGDPVRDVREMAKESLEGLLEQSVGLDVSAAGEHIVQRITELKQWWQQTRADRRLDQKVELPEPGEVAAAKPAPREPEPARPEAKVDEPTAAGVAAETLDAGLGGVAGLEDLSVMSGMPTDSLGGETEKTEASAPEPAGLDDDATGPVGISDLSALDSLGVVGGGDGLDGGLDSGLDDAGPDLGLGGGLDDAGPDLGLGGGLDDAGPDIGLGGGLDDAGPDVGLDSGLDDAGPDVGLDSGLDGMGLAGLDLKVPEKDNETVENKPATDAAGDAKAGDPKSGESTKSSKGTETDDK
ncbi:MAG: HEAT repeat domain-containing protein [Deltaproteobacteria bacterium]|nr:HEAT repeat domain-containing protein [Deltaproteobacteria bacterium]